MCGFCEFKKKNAYGEITGDRYSCAQYAPSVYMQKKGKKFLLVAAGEMITKFDIIACPVCGRILKGI